MSEDHDLGSYTSIGVYYDCSTPDKYISDCEYALEVFDLAVSWEELKELYEKQYEDEEEFEDFN